MNPLFLQKHNSYNQNKNQSKTNNKLTISQLLSYFRKNHLLLNCKSPIKTKDTEFVIVKSLWNDLGVNIEYQNEFKKFYNGLENDKEKMELLINEKNHLRNFRESLIKLSEEISNRDDNIFNLKKYCNEIEKHTYILDNYINSCNNKIKEEEREEIPSDLFYLIQKEIKNYRINTVNVINRIINIREISSYYELNKKWDISNINRSYAFKQNYLLIMLNDIEFFNNSILFNYITTDNNLPKTDLFFSNCKYLVINENTKLKLSISLELQAEINKCKYVIFQDNLLNNIKKEINNKEIIINQKNFISEKSRPVSGSNVTTLSKKTQSEIFLSNDKNEKKYYEIFGHNKINLSRTLYYLKKTMGNKYQKMFCDENDLYNVKRNINIMNKFFSIPSQNDENDLYDNNENFENNDEIDTVDNNNKDIIVYNNKNKWNNYYNDNLITNESIDDNNYDNNYNTIIKEQMNKNNEDLKSEKNRKNFHEKKQYTIKKRKKLKKKPKIENKEKMEYKEKKKDENNNEKEIVNKEEKKENKENKTNLKIECNNLEKLLMRKEKRERKEKRQKEIKKFKIDNIKAVNVIDINIITEKKDENEIVQNNNNKKNNNYNIGDLNKENINEKMNSKNFQEKKNEEKNEIDKGKKDEEKEVESYISISQDYSKFSDDKFVSKEKLLQYRQYTEEEIKKYNKDFVQYYGDNE